MISIRSESEDKAASKRVTEPFSWQMRKNFRSQQANKDKPKCLWNILFYVKCPITFHEEFVLVIFYRF